jgi:hypothetical protein
MDQAMSLDKTDSFDIYFALRQNIFCLFHTDFENSSGCHVVKYYDMRLSKNLGNFDKSTKKGLMN